MGIFSLKSNPFTGTAEWDIRPDDYDFHQEIARSAFADMLHDSERNKKYYIALKRAIDKKHKQGKKANVLDIGTGTGLLSIMAAQCGADSIVACEAFQPMAECAQRIIQQNNVADKITVIPKFSTDILVGENGDMKERANILVTEVFDTELIGEGALRTFSHAHRCLLEEDCIVVPDSAVIYAQVVECPTLQKWNKLNDLVDEDLNVILRTPEKIKLCAGAAAVHDIQLSQLDRRSFRALSEPIAVLHYDWSGRVPTPQERSVPHAFTATDTGVAQIVFMWWELIMDKKGTVLSCAPWWHHPEAKLKAKHPEDTIPWRDHWMQAVYYLPTPINTQKGKELTLISCQDDYSLWFYLEDDNVKCTDLSRPICECSVHVALSRTHISYMNDGKRNKKFLSAIREATDENSVVLNINEGSLFGLAAAAMGVKSVFHVEGNKIITDVIKQYAKANNIKNMQFLPGIIESGLSQVTHVIGDPSLPNAILPWDNLRLAYILHKYKFRDTVKVIPHSCTLWAVPVQFLDLQKIRIPLGLCEGIDMSIFDKLIETSRQISDDKLEAQPLWEYPCVCRGAPQPIFNVDFHNLQPTYLEQRTVQLSCSGNTESAEVNGVAVWASWRVGDTDISSGSLSEPLEGERMRWDSHTRQAVYILENSCSMRGSDNWTYKVDCDLDKGKFHVEIDIPQSSSH